MILAALAYTCLSTRELTYMDTNGAMRAVVGTPKHKASVVFLVLKDCPIARQFTPEIKRIAQKYEKRGVTFTMAFCERVKLADAKRHLTEFGIIFPGVVDDGKIQKLARATAVPTAAIFDSAGKLWYTGRIDDRYPKLGVLTTPKNHDLRRALDQFLSGQPVNPSSTQVVGCSL